MKSASTNSSKQSLASLGEAKFRCGDCKISFKDLNMWYYHLSQWHGYSFVVVE